MGLSIGAVIVRQNTHQFSAGQIVSYLFGPRYTELKEQQLSSLPAGKKFDARNNNCVIVYKLDSYIAIINSKFTSAFYKPGSAEMQQVYQYFKHPAQIFALENYDSGDTYGYALIERGKLIRWVRLTADKTHPDTYGEPLNIELKLLHAKKTQKRESDGELYTYFTNPNNQTLFTEGDLTLTLLREVMQHETGLQPDNLYDKATERHYFMAGS